MTIRLSKDDGTTWSEGLVVYEGPAAYSSLTKISDGKVGLLYEKDKDIAFAKIPLDRIGN